MKDNKSKCLPKHTEYKDVVVIGNGPSGISLSYMLSGYWPYYNKVLTSKHPDELLRARLNYADNTKSLVEQDLTMLAEGLEGRSTNPISLLLDSLQHPCADLGMNLPSMLEYKYHPEKEIKHVVIGKGGAGGAWHRMDPNVRTLSLADWMSLPGLDFKTWKKIKETEKIVRKLKEKKKSCINCDKLKNSQNITDNENFEAICNKCILEYNNNNDVISLNSINIENKIIPPRCRTTSVKRQDSSEVETRALISSVAEYYKDFVKIMALEKYFQNNSIVKTVMPLSETGLEINDSFNGAKWLVCGLNRTTNKTFGYICKNIVLANGSSDFANRLGIRNEGLAKQWIKYELPQLEMELYSLSEQQKSAIKPVVIVGAGLSAADAVRTCRSLGIHVIHVYRHRTVGLDKMLPENVYPEYHEIHKMMQNSSRKYEYYTPYPEHTVSSINPNYSNNGARLLTLQHLKTGDQTELEVSYCAILIGSRPDFRFLSNVYHKNNQENCIAMTNDSWENQQKMNKKISWLKNLCTKCKHLSLCERRRNDYRHMCEHKNDINKHLTTVNDNNNYCDVLHKTMNDSSTGIGLGENNRKPIDGKSNPIAINKYTHEVLNSNTSGLYAMGPLVSDNFVRFIPGGALAITSALHKEND